MPLRNPKVLTKKLAEAGPLRLGRWRGGRHPSAYWTPTPTPTRNAVLPARPGPLESLLSIPSGATKLVLDHFEPLSFWLLEERFCPLWPQTGFSQVLLLPDCPGPGLEGWRLRKGSESRKWHLGGHFAKPSCWSPDQEMVLERGASQGGRSQRGLPADPPRRQDQST